MLVLSFGALRRRYYEFFYISHMFLGVVFLVGCMLHYPPLKVCFSWTPLREADVSRPT
jgi:hypothetical protein